MNLRWPRDTGPSRRVRRLVADRSDGRCEFVGCGLEAVCVHHRFERGQGGVGPKSPARAWINLPANLLDSCNYHNQWASNMEPHEAWQMGWICKGRNAIDVRHIELPWETPVVTCHDALPVLLDNDGGWQPAFGSAGAA